MAKGFPATTPCNKNYDRLIDPKAPNTIFYDYYNYPAIQMGREVKKGKAKTRII